MTDPARTHVVSVRFAGMMTMLVRAAAAGMLRVTFVPMRCSALRAAQRHEHARDRLHREQDDGKNQDNDAKSRSHA